MALMWHWYSPSVYAGIIIPRIYIIKHHGIMRTVNIITYVAGSVIII